MSKTPTEYSKDRRARLKNDGVAEVRGVEAPTWMHEQVKKTARMKIKRLDKGAK